jgi:hypothetical protein
MWIEDCLPTVAASGAWVAQIRTTFTGLAATNMTDSNAERQTVHNLTKMKFQNERVETFEDDVGSAKRVVQSAMKPMQLCHAAYQAAT